MRGYRNLKKSGRSDIILKIKRELTNTNLEIDHRYFSTILFGSGLVYAEIVLRQYLLLRIGGINLNRALLLAAGKNDGKVIFTLPPQWIKVIEKNGFKVNLVASNILWAGYTLLAYFYGLLIIGKIYISSLISKRLPPRRETLSSYVYFHGLSVNNIPHVSSNSNSYDIISWYTQWQGKRPEINEIHHSVRNVPCKSINGFKIVTRSGPLPALSSFREFSSYLKWALKALAITTFTTLRGSWWHAFILNQAAIGAQARIVSSDLLAREYLFHHSGMFFKPLWTYEVENRGLNVSLYFYSTNSEGIKRSEGLALIHYGWEAMNWSRYLVWDDGQADFIRRVIGEYNNIEIVGPIWFSDSNLGIPNLPAKSAAVFDVQPMRDSYYQTLTHLSDYYTPQIANQFLMDIKDVLAKFGFYMAHKRKRDIGRLVHPHYGNTIRHLEKLKSYHSINYDIAAESLIKECEIVISIPFTSTAIIGIKANKPSVYYDPLCIIRKDDPAAHGIEILSGINELESWIVDNLCLSGKFSKNIK